ncbi:MAG TPA: anthranilate synthase component I [Longimicrobiales bacterium]|nr:anthranilate synthase component I [Longimicrobiales bacterium]
MQLEPSFDRFREYAADSRVVPVWREFLFDVDTAVTAYAKLARPPFGFLLESVVGGEQWARYSFVGTAPAAAWRLQHGVVSWWTPATGWTPVDSDDPLADLDARLRARRPADVPGLPRLWGGAVGYFGYDVVRHIERLPDGPPDDLGVPDGLFVFTDVVLAIDNLRGRAMAIAAVPVEDGLDDAELRERYLDAGRKADALIDELASTPGPAPLRLSDEPDADPAFTSTSTREEFEAGVERIREHIRAGDAFQVVLSQRLGVTLEASPFDLYRALRTLNPSPYLYFLELDGVSLVGSSPEVLVRVEDGTVTVRPIAGTRPRGHSAEEDRALAEELLADEKELAEHRMLVDLGRNDVGRIAEYGTVTVPDLMVVERYSHVMHLVSQVEGRLRSRLGAMDVLRACFPAGTVSGAPKIRAMEIIDELEPVRRGPYAGAVGHFGFGGATMDTAITIRTVLVAGGRAWVQAGAGIVADSDPAREYEETLNKARALLRAAAVVGAGVRPGGQASFS